VSWGRRWYLVGWDTDRSDWRTFRADRVAVRTPNGPRFTHRTPPDGDLTAYLTRTMGREMWPLRAVLKIHAPASELAGRVEGEVTPIDARTCRLELASDSYDLVAFVVGMLDVAFEVESPPELAERLRVLANRYAEAIGAQTANEEGAAAGSRRPGGRGGTRWTTTDSSRRIRPDSARWRAKHANYVLERNPAIRLRWPTSGS
jgi:hypothetical protein